MCGLAAALLTQPGALPDAELRRRGLAMATILQHRGPDGEGVWTDHGVVLAHRRLGGRQPPSVLGADPPVEAERVRPRPHRTAAIDQPVAGRVECPDEGGRAGGRGQLTLHWFSSRNV